MSIEEKIISQTFAYISAYLFENNYKWGINNLPRCGNETFTFDSRHTSLTEGALFTIYSWNLQIAQPSVQDLSSLTDEQVTYQRKLIFMFNRFRETIISSNQQRVLNGLQELSLDEIVSICPQEYY